MSIKAWNIILFLSLVGVLGLGGWVLYQNHMQNEAEKEAARIAEIEKSEAKQAVEKEFEALINRMLADLRDKAGEYSQRRKVLLDLIRPANLSTPDYVDENYEISETTTMALQLQMTGIMGVFEEMGQQVEEVRPRMEALECAYLADNWMVEQDRLVKDYIDFFHGEQILLTKVGDLMAFYRDKKDELRVDFEKNRVRFTNIEDQGEAFNLRTQVNNALDRQKKSLAVLRGQDKGAPLASP